MRAMVFAAGVGSRLRPLTDRLPKPAVPFFHRPICWYALDHLARTGVNEVVLNAHYLAGELEQALRDAPRIGGLEPRIVREAELLGTGGGLRNAVALQSRRLGRELGDDEPFVVTAGDIFFAPDLAGAIALHRRSRAYATMVLRSDP